MKKWNQRRTELLRHSHAPLPREYKRAVVKFYLADRGYGFLVDNATGADVFFNIAQVPDTDYRPQRDDAVQYQLGEKNGRKCALNVTAL